MENNRKLCQAYETSEWQNASAVIQAGEWTIEEWVQFNADRLIDRVLAGECSLNDLRGGVAWANALDLESVSMGVDLHADDEDGKEALSRRLVHHAGRLALNSLKSHRKRNNAYALRRQQAYRLSDYEVELGGLDNNRFCS